MGVTDVDNNEETLSSDHTSVNSTDFRDSSEINGYSGRVEESDTRFSNITNTLGAENRPNGHALGFNDKDDTGAELVPMLRENGDDIGSVTHGDKTEDGSSSSGPVPIDRGWAWMILLGRYSLIHIYSYRNTTQPMNM